MKTNQLFIVPVLLLAVAIFSGCLKDDCEREVSYIRLDPVYKTPDEIHKGAIVMETPRDLKNPGQIYFYNNFIFINEIREGIHIIDNSDPSKPIQKSFLKIPGNENLAIRNNVLYANSYIDLLAIDLVDYSLKGRVESVFPPLWEDLANNRIAVYYTQTPVKEKMDCQTFGTLVRRGDVFFAGGPLFTADVSTVLENSSNNGGAKGNSTGIGGSMARFSAIGDYLYVVDQWNLKIFDLHSIYEPKLANTVNLGWGIETIFPYQDKLFIGSNSGMFIFDNSNPVAPFHLSTFQHATACDPVFVKDNYAYVTLRDGNSCQGFNNQLDLIDISNLTNPFLVKTFPMENPHGLSIKENTLLLCEGKSGIKSFDITDPKSLDKRLLDRVKNIHAFDVITLAGPQNVAMVIGKDGFYQYNFDDPSDLKFLSKIQVVQ